MASPVTFSGLASGIDSSALIDNLISLERLPIRRLEQRKAGYASQSSKFGTLRTRLNALKSSVEALDTRDEVISSKVQSSDESVFRATVLGTPTTGNSTITVANLAQAERTYSNGFSDRSATGLFGTGTLEITVGDDDPLTIDVTSEDGIEAVARKINDAGGRVTADVIFDGTDYLLRVAGTDPGADNAIEFAETGTTLGLTAPANERTQALDASFTVDGIAMTRPTNSVADAIPGVKLELTGTTGTDESVALEVQRDPDALAQKVDDLIESYNAVQSFINTEFAFFGQSKGPGSLSGDATLRSVQSRVRSVIGGSPSGLAGAYQTLGAIGIESDQTGTLSLDRTKLEAALEEDPDGVMALFNGDEDAGVTGIFESLVDVVDEFAGDDGILKSRIDSLEGRSEDIDRQIDGMELRLDKREELLRKQFSTMETTISGLQNQGQQLLAAIGSV